jgi:tungstate transport system substrate-binding protein
VNKKLFKIMSTLITLLMVFSLVGCGASNTATNSSEPPKPANPDLILATTTSTQDSGLLDVLIPLFEKKTGYKVKTTAVGTGAAITLGEKGEADVLLTHAPSSEKKIVDSKAVVDYQLVMHNDFVIVGPANDPAKVKGLKTSGEAFKAISDAKAVFISRGDNSGTHTMEKAIWTKANLKPAGTWYQESGQGMGQTLKIASEKTGYTLTDRASYLASKANTKLEIVLEGEPALLNIYHVMEVNSEKFPKVNKVGAKAFVDFMVDKDTQAKIAEFGKDKYGQALFFADAGKSEKDLVK